MRIRNYYYLIAGLLAILFAVTHAWNGQSAVLPMLDSEGISVDAQTIFTYVWHIITAENLIFGFAFIIMSYQNERSKIRFAAWLIAAILMVRLIVILGITASLNVSGLTNTLMDSIAIVIYVALILWGTSRKKKQDEGQQTR